MFLCVCVWRYKLPFPYHLWLVPNVVMPIVPFDTWKFSDTSLNGHSGIHINNVLHPLYKLLCPDTVWTLWALFGLCYRHYFPTRGFQLFPNFEHKWPGNFPKKKKKLLSQHHLCFTYKQLQCFSCFIYVSWCSEKIKAHELIIT